MCLFNLCIYLDSRSCCLHSNNALCNRTALHRSPSLLRHLCLDFSVFLDLYIPFLISLLLSCKKYNSITAIKRQAIFILVTHWLNLALQTDSMSHQIKASLHCVNLGCKEAMTPYFLKTSQGTKTEYVQVCENAKTFQPKWDYQFQEVFFALIHWHWFISMILLTREIN